MASNFEERLTDLKDSMAQQVEKLMLSDVRTRWSTLLGKTSTDIVDPFDSAAVREGFSREQEAADYEKALTTPQSFRIAQAAKIQSDTLAALERDSRMRHRTRVRMLAHSVAKMTTHGLEDGPLQRGVLFVNRLKEQTDGSND